MNPTAGPKLSSAFSFQESSYSNELTSSISNNSRNIELQYELLSRKQRGFKPNIYGATYSSETIGPKQNSIETNSNKPDAPGPDANATTLEAKSTKTQAKSADNQKSNILRERLEIPNLWKVFRTTSLIQRIIWSFVFLLSLCLFLYETIDRIEKLIDPPISASVKLAVSF